MTAKQIKLATAVAARLGWPALPGCDGQGARAFFLADGGRLYIQSGQQRGQLHISASIASSLREPGMYHRAGEAPKTAIDVSEAKAAQRIATEEVHQESLES